MEDDRRWSGLASRQIPATLSWDPALLASLRGADVLDLGCGPEPSFAGLEHLRGRHVGVDANPAALRAAESTVDGAVFVRADARDLPFEQDSFDLALCKALLTALLDDGSCDRALAEAARVLRPGGALLVADFLVNREVAYFADRYRLGEALGLPAGAFEVKGPDGDTLYLARHFTEAWVGEWVDRASGMDLESYEERPVTTRSGRSTRGFLALVRAAGPTA